MYRITYILIISVAFTLKCHGLGVRFRKQYGWKSWDNKVAFAQSMSADTDDKNILRQIDKWACIKNCGACCKLGPLESRPDLVTYLSKAELKTYKALIGPDDWCINFDQSARMCKIYESRPGFCRVEPAKFKTMFGVEESELNEFCTFCCTEQITDVYGGSSDEMHRFKAVIDALE